MRNIVLYSVDPGSFISQNKSALLAKNYPDQSEMSFG